MEDIVDYKLPFGKLGELFQPILVKPKLKEIFQYRKMKLEALFGEYSSVIPLSPKFEENSIN